MYALSVLAVVATAALNRASADTMVPLSTFTDNECNTPSTTVPSNTSVPLGACVVTIGMGSFKIPTIPCSGGGATHVRSYGFTDTSCTKDWLYFASYGGGCEGADSPGNAFGSIILSCYQDDANDDPQPTGTTTLSVGAAATGGGGSSATNVGSASASPTSSSPPSSSGSSTGGSSTDNPISGLSNGAKIGIGVGAGAVVLLVLLGLLRSCMRRRPQPPQQRPPIIYPNHNQQLGYPPPQGPPAGGATPMQQQWGAPQHGQPQLTQGSLAASAASRNNAISKWNSEITPSEAVGEENASVVTPSAAMTAHAPTMISHNVQYV